MQPPLLQVEQLDVRLKQSVHPLLHDVSFTLSEHQCLGVVGESGSGKSLLCRTLMGLFNPAFRYQGGIDFAGTDWLSLSEVTRRRYRGRDISLIPQQPMTAFDPLQSIGKQMVETFCTHQAIGRREAKGKAIGLLEQVRLEQAARRFDAYPAQLSGGMLQRVTLAMALGLAPRLLIADEPTTALDTVTQAEIVQLFAELRTRQALTLLFVSHDFGVIQRVADQVLVLHQGCVVEQGPTAEVVRHPQHAHTQYLVAARQALLQPYQQGVMPLLLEERVV